MLKPPGNDVPALFPDLIPLDLNLPKLDGRELQPRPRTGLRGNGCLCLQRLGDRNAWREEQGLNVRATHMRCSVSPSGVVHIRAWSNDTVIGRAPTAETGHAASGEALLRIKRVFDGSALSALRFRGRRT